ncbi:ABC transporter permease [Natronosporangium hydrolyticum]|uniref:ABC transporter permease n=1 Tax=Natronosporangium hydrolyticum TaxID=2811111 RepID=A0A895YM12_9ACTN|nr:ABC transporter permease [Natronosporangium hydrolyticum]QSB17005.1 ABC transporter permease [Natronosporangium hydrolyticum]
MRTNLRLGWRHLRQLRLIMEWQVSRLRSVAALIVAIQSMLAVGLVVGFGFLVGDDADSGRFLATGAPTISLAVVGFVLLPQHLVRASLEGSLLFARTFPVGRFTFLMADTIVWVLAAIPGLVSAILVGAVVYGFSAPSPWAVPALLLAALTFNAIGYAMAALAKPMAAAIYAQVLMLGTVMFSPVLFPLERVPSWFAGMHKALPVEPIANLVRGTLAPEFFAVSASDVVRAALWCGAGLLLSTIGIGRRN